MDYIGIEYDSTNENDKIITDMYSYMSQLLDKPKEKTLKTVYYKGLGRERWCSYNVNNNSLEDIKVYGDANQSIGLRNSFFLKYYGTIIDENGVKVVY